jgi:hypothetical protein
MAKIISEEEISASMKNLILTQKIARENEGILKDTIILHINHIFADILAFNKILTDTLGAEVFYVSIPYNNNYAQNLSYYYLRAERKGICFSNILNNKPMNNSKLFNDLMDVMIYNVAYTMLKINPLLENKKLIIVQDGGYTSAVDGFNSSQDSFANVNNLIGMVEQTRAGTRMIQVKNSQTKLTYPVLTIARSKIKIRMESAFVAQRVFEELNSLFYSLGLFLRYKTVIVGGFGIIGRQLAFYLRSIDIEVLIYDKDETVLRLARKEGFYTIAKIEPQHLTESFCYVGCTGTKSFTIRELNMLLQSGKAEFYLASGSSKRSEFLELIYFFESDDHDVEKTTLIKRYPFLTDISDIKIEGTNEGFVYRFNYKMREIKIFLLAEGFPVNMYSPNSISIPDRAIDPTQALMLESIIALKKNRLTPGLHYVGVKENEHMVNEKKLLSEWCRLNDLNIITNNPFNVFREHPLEDLLTENDMANLH